MVIEDSLFLVPVLQARLKIILSSIHTRNTSSKFVDGGGVEWVHACTNAGSSPHPYSNMPLGPDVKDKIYFSTGWERVL